MCVCVCVCVCVCGVYAMWSAGYQFPNQGLNLGPCSESAESQPLNCQRIPQLMNFLQNFVYVHQALTVQIGKKGHFIFLVDIARYKPSYL